MVLTEFLSDVRDWWVWEARQAGMGRYFASDRRPVAVLRIGRNGNRVEDADGNLLLADTSNLAGIGQRLRSTLADRRLRRGPVDIVIEQDRHLARQLSSRRLPRSRMQRMAQLDYQAEVPFQSSDCALLLPEYDEARRESVYFIVRRSHFAPLLDGLRAARIDIGRIRCAGKDGLVPADRRSAAALVRPRPIRRVGRAVRRAAVASALVAAVALIGVAHWRYAAAIGSVEREIAAAERAAVDVRRDIADRERRLAEIDVARRAKSEAVPLVHVIEELARALPDETWLSDVDFRDATVTISGTSEAAADLIPVLDALPLFHAPAFSQPVVRDPESGLERFTITLETEPARG